MLEDHRTGPRHDSLLTAYPEDESNSGWMISYIDIMTLLVALFVIIIAAANVTSPSLFQQQAADEDGYESSPAIEIPLPDTLAEARQQRAVLGISPSSDMLSPFAISAALGVAGLPKTRSIVADVPPLLARIEEASIDTQPSTVNRRLPQLLLPSDERQSVSPLADYMVVLTDRPPVNVQTVSDVAMNSALALDERLSERVEASTYLPNLEGVEVSRVAEGISLRVQDRLLFPSADAQLTEGGSSLVGSLMDTIQRFDGEVWVEGHSDSQSINTPEFSSNWALSSARAIAIVEALEAAGVAPERLRAVGLAATQPLEDNDTVEGRARNRRVEVVIHVD
ncbi:OmpA family protein [Vreelandella venusta]|uniref:OmpA family protein n=1 Tax=Vreelandella venusta TaxID=44935 RepID=UPI0022856996|nr:OmpA family protein [Halomonas venusta]WAM50989.1 OmpA family protein [Halomonas venusta]WAM54494.1 OmpA family protein [Halomonas venusta]